MNVIDPDVIIKHLTPPYVRTIPFGEYRSKKKALVDDARGAFEKGESQLEELLKAGRLDEEKKHVFAKMEKHIRRLLLFDLGYNAYIFAMRYVRVQQQYLIH